jgi:hypothetical protein
VFDYQTVKLLHRHSDLDYSPMTEIARHDPAGSDPERSWKSGARVFRCSACEAEVVVEPASEADPTAGSAQLK